MTLADVLPAVQQLTDAEKLRLIHILVEELDTTELDTEDDISPFEHGQTYYLHTPYGSYEAAAALAQALAEDEKGIHSHEV